jgi:hypothetical protein
MHRIVATIPDQCLEPTDIARHHGWVQPHELAITFDGVRADNRTKLEKRLAQVLPGLSVEVGAP